MEEIWKPVVGYEGWYEVSNLGRIKRIKIGMGASCKILKNQKSSNGYRFITLTKNGTQKQFTVHRIVSIAFIPNPENKLCVNHIDSNRTNNNIHNLEWVTYSENIRHSIMVGNRNHIKVPNKKGEEHYNAKLKEKDVRLILDSYLNTRQLAELFGVQSEAIARIRRGFSWKHISRKGD